MEKDEYDSAHHVVIVYIFIAQPFSQQRSTQSENERTPVTYLLPILLGFIGGGETGDECCIKNYRGREQ